MGSTHANAERGVRLQRLDGVSLDRPELVFPHALAATRVESPHRRPAPRAPVLYVQAHAVVGVAGDGLTAGREAPGLRLTAMHTRLQLDRRGAVAAAACARDPGIRARTIVHGALRAGSCAAAL